MARDPFSGRWRMNPTRSQLRSAPDAWIQVVDVSDESIRVNEEITRNGQRFEVQAAAKFDGHDYPVLGSPGADMIAYERLDLHNIFGKAKKNGVVSLTETVSVSPDGLVMTMKFSVVTKDGTRISGVAVFEKDDD